SVSPGQRYRVRIDRSQCPRILSDPPPDRFILFRERFHILTYPPPPSLDQAKLFFDAHFIPYQGIGERPSRAVQRPLRKNELVVWINVTWPVAPQLANLEKLLKVKQQPDRRQLRLRVNKYALYLRLLDAKVAGATNDKILGILYPKIANQPPDRN